MHVAPGQAGRGAECALLQLGGSEGAMCPWQHSSQSGVSTSAVLAANTLQIYEQLKLVHGGGAR